MNTSINQFNENYDGILTHAGEIKVAKGGVEQKILHIDDNGTVLVRGRKKAYLTLIHAFISANDDYHFGLRKDDTFRFVDEKRILIHRKSGRTTIINLDLIIGICIKEDWI